MEKKIIALACVMLLLVSCFVACGKKPTIKGKNGMEYVMVTDKEGNSVVNENGDIAVYVTDTKGKYIKDSNGERQTNYIEFPRQIINGTTFETANFKFTVPKDEGWTLGDDGMFTRDAEGQTYITVKDLGEVGIMGTLETLIEKIKADNEPVMETIQSQYPDATMTVTDIEITEKNIPATVVEFVVKDSSGNLVYHAHGTYYLSNGHYFSVEYICQTPQYDVSAEELLKIINTGLTIKG